MKNFYKKRPVSIKMFTRSFIFLYICIQLSHCVDKSNCNIFQKYNLWKSASPSENEVLPKQIDNSCGVIPKDSLRKNDINNVSKIINSYNKCNILEKRLLTNKFCQYHPDELLDVPQIIARHGYLSETHTIVTEDGYILQLHRIPKPKNATNQPRQPVFLQHGLLGSSIDWIVNERNNSLAFLLADHGYDVWLGNARGNDYSRGHVTFPTDTAQYWNFSFHEMGTKDLPAIISYISTTTGKSGELIYIGHSMGTTIFFVYASKYPESAKYVKVMTGMAPTVYLTHTKTPLRYFAPFSVVLQWLETYLGFHQFIPNNKILRFLSCPCKLFRIKAAICENLIFAIGGLNKEEFNTPILPLLLSKNPSGASTKTIIHYAQEMRNNGEFQEFDYGPTGNLIEYGTETPPKYNISNVLPPIYLMYGMDDMYSNSADVLRLGAELKHLVGLYKVPLDSYNHVDFILGKNAKEFVFTPLLNCLEKYKTIKNN